METLQAILNTLKLIETKGDNTILMARCLEALNGYILNQQTEVAEENKDE